MSDIVEWLQRQAGLDERYDEAADEIERLRKEIVTAVNDAMYPSERQVVQMAIIRAMGEWRCWADYVDCAYALINVTRQADSLRREHNHCIEAEMGGQQRPEPDDA